MGEVPDNSAAALMNSQLLGFWVSVQMSQVGMCWQSRSSEAREGRVAPQGWGGGVSQSVTREGTGSDRCAQTPV